MDTTKIIKGAVSNGRYTVTAPIVKEDYGLYLQIEGVELPSTYEVDFSNSENSGTSVTMIGNADGVLIPAQFISTGKDVFAFLYHVGQDFGRTVYKFRIPNKVRPDRTNEQPTPEEQSTIDQAISALNEAVEQTAQDVISADQSAQSASTDADRAEQAKDDAVTFAQRSANSAQASADYSASASQSAQASANSASQSAQIKADVEELVDDAQGYAQASAQSASASANSASDSQGYAQSASASAQSASGYASNAQTSANTASGKATEASGYAQTASGKASEASQSATNASQSAQTAEQAKTDAQTAQGLAESARDSAISAKNDAEQAKADAESARDEAQTIVDGISGALDDKAPVITDTASGTIASFPDGADDIPLKSLVVDINPIQDLHGYDSPWVAGGGKNKFGGTYGTKWFFPTPITVQSGDKWAVSTSVPASGNPRINFYTGTQGETRYYNVGINTTKNNRKVRIITWTEEITITAVMFDIAECTDIQIENGDTATEYAPYENICPISGWTGMQLNANGTVIPISWQTEAGTVYGGKLDVISGELTVYPYYASYNGETLTGRWISDRDVYAVGTTPTIGAQVVNIGAQGTEIQLEPHEVASILGVNNIFADTGDSEVEYRTNTKLWVQKKIAEAISALS